jgi:signal peptidase II
MLQIIIIVLALVADQLTKYLLVPMILDGSVSVIPGVFQLTYVQNEGASFGILQGARVVFIIITLIVIAGVAVFMIKTRKTQPMFLKISLSLIVSGAVGNLYDRIVFGFVRDMFNFQEVHFPWVFNVADACLVVGSIMLGIYILFIYKEKDGKSLLARRGKNADGADDDAI